MTEPKPKRTRRKPGDPPRPMGRPRVAEPRATFPLRLTPSMRARAEAAAAAEGLTATAFIVAALEKALAPLTTTPQRRETMSTNKTVKAIAAEQVAPLPEGARGKAEKEAHDLVDRRRRAAGDAGRHLGDGLIALVARAGQGVATEDDGIALRDAAAAMEREVDGMTSRFATVAPTVTSSREVDAHNERVQRELGEKQTAAALLRSAADICPPDMRGARRNDEIRARAEVARPALLPVRDVMVYAVRDGGAVTGKQVKAASEQEALDSAEADYRKAGHHVWPGVGCFYRGSSGGKIRVDVARVA